MMRMCCAFDSSVSSERDLPTSRVEFQRHREHAIHADQHGVAGGLDHGHVEIVVARGRGRDGERAHHALVGLGHARQRLGRGALHRERRGAGLDDAAEVQHVAQRLAGMIEMLGEDREDRVEVGLADAGAAAGLLDQAEGLEMDHGLAHRVARYAEPLGQLALVGQEIAHLHPLHDLAAQGLPDVLDGRLSCHGLPSDGAWSYGWTKVGAFDGAGGAVLSTRFSRNDAGSLRRLPRSQRSSACGRRWPDGRRALPRRGARRRPAPPRRSPDVRSGPHGCGAARRACSSDSENGR